MSPALWPVVAAAVAALGSAFLATVLLAYREKPGATWLAVTLSSQAVFCATTGVGYLVSDPPTRLLLETTVWTALAIQVVSFLAFTLSYSGREHLVDTRTFHVVFLFPVVTGGLMLTNPYHHLIWPAFRVVPTAGLSTVVYTPVPVGVALVVLGIFIAATGALVLVDTAVSYSLYRVEAIAIALSTIPPGIAEVAWLLSLGPYPQLNLVPLAFIPHILVDGYAVLGTDMFEFNPTTRRVVDNTQLDHLESPVVVVNRDRRVINLNAAATAVFGVAESAALKRDLDELVGTAVDLDATDQTISTRVDGSLQYLAITPSEHTDPSGTVVAHSVVFQDITAQRRREQRLDVLNRVLRHNIRNDLNVVVGNLELARSETSVSADGGQHARTQRDDRLATAERYASGLLELAEDARTIDRVVDRTDVTRDAVSLRRVVDAAVADADVDRTVTVEVDEDAVARTDPDLLSTMAARLLLALAEYTDCDVDVRLDVTDDAYGLQFHTATPLPSHEVDAVTAESETALNHASSLDLWMVRWGAEILGCELLFGEGATATVRVPRDGA
ncbi:histidine kinase N-terminal 7TM domain-containing protein [Halogeometricum limi]|uniref:PAS fold-containing protein n=1 Tax=Halogeometricum limi TaxID=555875 RepID=A0A1I6G3C1_9EURY|nr:histidine kinase N-terminal 7TM domain-containing protein [Halogeometricum limi]SFR36679.1 PAS fold-containing protein [Halogeometricum limi]